MPDHRPYRPSNTAESWRFDEAWCNQCQRDAKTRETGDWVFGCGIRAATAIYLVDDPEYPEAWTYAADGSPCCTAFVPEHDGAPIPDNRQERFDV